MQFVLIASGGVYQVTDYDDVDHAHPDNRSKC